MRIVISREADIPDPLKLERFRRAPEFGPKILFFSGGSALRQTCRELLRFTHNSIHIITPFDSGGSSAVIRKAFRMPAVGDIRNRLMALANQNVQGNPDIFELFATRLPKDSSPAELTGQLTRLCSGRHPLIRKAPDPMRKILRNHFMRFLELMPDSFDLAGASLGNLVLTAGYLDNRRRFDAVIYIFTKLVDARGVVRPVINKDLHLAARLANGRVIVGQHRLTGKEAAPLTSPIVELWLTRDLDDPAPVQAGIRSKIREKIAEAELICYPIGSFYSSVMANLLPAGVGKAVTANACPKVFVPNPDADPEVIGQSVAEQIRILRRRLLADAGENPPHTAVGYVLADVKRGRYPNGLEPDALRELGVQLIDCPLISKESAPRIDPGLLAGALASLT